MRKAAGDPHIAIEHMRLLTCSSSDLDDKMGLGMPTRPGIISAPKDIWYAHTPQTTMVAAKA